MSLRKHWLSVVGALSLAESAWRGTRWLLDLAGTGEFVVGHVREPGWIGSMVAFVLNPPPWIFFPCFVVGALLIWHDLRRSQKRERPQAPFTMGEPAWLIEARRREAEKDQPPS
jgi:hypothetical protein